MDMNHMFKYYYNDETKDHIVLKEWSKPFRETPKFAVCNKVQTKMIVCTSQDALLIDFEKDKKGFELDIDDCTGLSNIQVILAGEKNFYIFANKQEGKLGYYLLLISMANPSVENMQFLLKFENKLDVRDCDLYLLKEKPLDNEEQIFGRK